MDTFSGNPFGAAGDPFTKFWTDCMSKMSGAGFTPNAAPLSDESMKQMRGAFFDAWAHHCEEFMRSPAFLEGMKRAMDGALAFREQLNEFMTRALHEVQAPARSDTDSILLVLRSLEERVLDRLDQFEERITWLEERAADAQSPAATAGAPKSGAAAGRRKGGAS